MIRADFFVTLGDVAMMTSTHQLVTGAPTPSHRSIAGLANTSAHSRIVLRGNAGRRVHRAMGRVR